MQQPNEQFDIQNHYDVHQQEHMKKLKEKLVELKEEIMQMPKDPELFKNHQLPLARVKKIMKSDEDVRMIAQETPVLFAKACEIFIIELTHRAWQFTEDGKRRTLQKTDIATCIYNTEIFDFLMDIIPKDEIKSNQVPIKKPQGQDGYFSNVSQHLIQQVQMSQQRQGQQFPLTNFSQYLGSGQR
ncbi:unnamed protein product [Paramecium primaurelia]|uniref:Chromosome undetermined scaffold_16, whole genome shotgun sequence n=4 Tax=Paramecium TaxID=5884 RepID=A0C9I1_PARTE|nr:uncharacterized protein GSPATT00006754001 [Paramecium tetraurelia]XP_001449573.1 uncharacterized protein GSPATT00002305001 [Paramecium tetraurelia]CAD8048997.1 unnamed protein product [Paramecium primaurelia]CAD8141017.1 unnamed protein product [Paramecium octaurelia]CAD8151925.1 unnamed protein product [Paramecium pentaurelia]CAD8052427.1 unnamed protein product [Paramecium primaurelia]CAD8143762.1 unnamed protein product [Paramecium octaurelia]|eukprot:XP_001434845.1 hypothetical protein (macronuclear) [Paramecium tetraurelia strain d4-2]